MTSIRKKAVEAGKGLMLMCENSIDSDQPAQPHNLMQFFNAASNNYVPGETITTYLAETPYMFCADEQAGLSARFS